MLTILDRFGLSSFATHSFYVEQAKELEWKIHEVQDISDHLVKHYQCVVHELDSRFDDLVPTFGADCLKKLRNGITNWINGDENGLLKWSIFNFAKNG